METQNNDKVREAKAQNQLRKFGLGEAFTPALRKQVAEKVPVITHPFEAVFSNGDKATALLHLRMSDRGNHFLNSFDVEAKLAQPDGTSKSMKQTFYTSTKLKQQDGQPIKRQEQEARFTFKKAYNYLAGRPVYNTITTDKGASYKAWEVINHSKPMKSNGDYGADQYNDNYPFSLDKTLSKYAIIANDNPKYKAALMKDVERGNLQKTAFLDKEGNKVDLYISPVITKSELQLSEGIKIPPSQEGEKERIQFRILSKEEIEERGFKLSGKKQEQDIQQTAGAPSEAIPASTAQQPLTNETRAVAGEEKPVAQTNGQVVSNAAQSGQSITEPKTGAVQEPQGGAAQSEKQASPAEDNNRKQQKNARNKHTPVEGEAKAPKQAKKKGLHH